MHMMTVGKSFTFHAAHQLKHHNGKCKDLHGHTYKLEVTVTGKVKKPDGDPDEGMVIDFAAIKSAYEQFIEPYADHKFLNETLFGKVPNTLVDEDSARVPEALTTCENIARWIHGELQQALIRPDSHGSFLRVTLWETPTSFARVPADRNGLDHV